jgi:hypothetical protein
VSAGGDEMQIAGIQIATRQSGGMERAIAVPAQAIWRQDRDQDRDSRDVVPGLGRSQRLPKEQRRPIAAAVLTVDTIGSWDEVISKATSFRYRRASDRCGEPDRTFDLDPFAIAAP